ncbi:30S ribosomal protein S21, chloroplastic-like [Durio zibethinus]|uniref:30S ribosomal protein S21, chloroplastic-like n=1 Tax=Durio zibethinus TaxID=66656 RepID=A0A6P5ZID9_DURZI|nr:30S ribosomal protein S21, chloroplastic-like [Durio zibethinus]
MRCGYFLFFLLPSNPPPPPAKAPPLNNLSLSSQKPKNTLLSVSVQEDQSSSLSTELSSVICHSLEYANTLFFKSAYNVQVIVDDNEPEERLCCLCYWQPFHIFFSSLE